MRVTFLGTNGWYDTETGNTPCVFIETADCYIILDAGFGFYKVKDHVKSAKPVFLFISHFHLDHIIGLHTLLLLKLPQGINVYIPRRMTKALRAFLRRPYTAPLLMLPTKLRIREMTTPIKSPFFAETARLRHIVTCYGYRFNIEGKIITYCTDTGLCPNLKALASGADLFITECAMSPGEKAPNLIHITPETAAKVALETGAKKLALFHFEPGRYPTLKDRKKAEEAAKVIFSNTLAANDGTVIEV